MIFVQSVMQWLKAKNQDIKGAKNMKKWSMALVLLFCGMCLFAQSLFDVVTTGTPEQVQAAIKAGARIDDRDNWFSDTPLMWAAFLNENPDVIMALLNAGADGTIKSSEGKTAFDYAQQNQKLEGTKAYWDLNNARFQLEWSEVGPFV